MPLIPQQNPPYYTTNENATPTTTIKVYKALLLQSGTDAPTVTILQNTLDGTPVWTRQALGYYRATLAGQFPQNQTIAKPFGSTTSTAFNFLPIGNGTPLELAYTITNATDDYIELEIYNSTTYASVELSSVQSSGQKLLIDIEVYQ